MAKPPNSALDHPGALPPRETWTDLPPAERIAVLGHRGYVGGHRLRMWYGIAKRQFHFLVARGVRPEHRFLDVACGSLRLGQLMIPYLDAGNYFGLEAEPELVRAGLAHELHFDLVAQKRPSFGYGYDFDLSFVPGFERALAQSLFTHLSAEDIRRCMAAVRTRAAPDAEFYFTFFESDAPRGAGPSHPQKGWSYRWTDLAAMAEDTGWVPEYVGDWGHQRGQVMALARPA